VPYPPGGTADIIGRTIAEKLGVLWGQSVIVENRAGAGGTIGVDAVAKAAPDGYTMVLGVTGPLTIAPSINAQLAYDPLRDLVPITLVAAVPSLIAIHPSVPARDLKELIALAKSQPGKLTFASAGTGTSVHIAGELFKSMAGVDIIHVPYKGGAPALNDLLGGQVSMIIENMPQLLPQVRAGKIRALAVTSQQRSPTLADLPAVAEILPGYEATTWFGLLAPAKTPQEIVRKVQSDVAKIGMLPDVKERFTGLGADVIASTPEAFAKHLQSELVRFSKVIKDANIKAQ
jgi:tripartite-type tricarboxylate transporter receptor subunit TctC